MLDEVYNEVPFRSFAGAIISTLLVMAPALVIVVTSNRMRDAAVAALAIGHIVPMSALGGFGTLSVVVLSVLPIVALSLLSSGVLDQLPPRTPAAAVAVITPTVLWTAYLVGITAVEGISWRVDMWGGAVMWPLLSSLGVLAMVMPTTEKRRR